MTHSTDNAATAISMLDSTMQQQTTEEKTMDTLISAPAHYTPAEAYQYKLDVAYDRLADSDDDNDRAILAILNTDVDMDSAKQNGHEEQLDVSDWDTPSTAHDYGHGIFNVAHTARWTAPQVARSNIGPMQPLVVVDYSRRMGWTVRDVTGFNGAKHKAADKAVAKAAHKAAFPYMYNAAGNMPALNGRKWRAAMATISARIAEAHPYLRRKADILTRPTLAPVTPRLPSIAPQVPQAPRVAHAVVPVTVRLSAQQAASLPRSEF